MPWHHSGTTGPLWGPQSWTIPPARNLRSVPPHCGCGFGKHLLISPVCQMRRARECFSARHNCKRGQGSLCSFPRLPETSSSAATMMVESQLQSV